MWKETRSSDPFGHPAHARTRRAHPSAREALDAAVAAVETAAVPDFDGTHEELEELLLDGLNSGDAIEADETFWDRLRAETDKVAADYPARK